MDLVTVMASQTVVERPDWNEGLKRALGSWRLERLKVRVERVSGRIPQT